MSLPRRTSSRHRPASQCGGCVPSIVAAVAVEHVSPIVLFALFVPTRYVRRAVLNTSELFLNIVTGVIATSLFRTSNAAVTFAVAVVLFGSAFTLHKTTKFTKVCPDGPHVLRIFGFALGGLIAVIVACGGRGFRVQLAGTNRGCSFLEVAKQTLIGVFVSCVG